MAVTRNMSPEKHPMPTQDPAVRAHNFDEVALGYDEQTALAEAARCLNCKNPACVTGCPVSIRIPEFIAHVAAGEFEEAYRVIHPSSSLPAVCGRVCPTETPAVPAPNGHRVAVVGSGPSGLTCAGDLAKAGYAVTVFEALHVAGGVLMYGIPEFRLPKAIVQKEVDTLRRMGVDIQTNVVIGKTLTVDELFEAGYEAVFIGSGAGLPRFMNIPGESLKGVYSANEFLTRSNLMKAYRADSATPILHARRVAVVGGGNVAMDAARTALRLGAEEVSVVYRRSMEELPARREEVEHAEEEGVVFRLLCNPTEILGYHNPDDRRDPKNGFVTGIRCIRMELGEPDEKGRRRPVEVPDSEFTLDVDCVIMAIGTSPNPLIKSTTTGLEVNRHGGIVVQEETGATSRAGVFAGGDAVTGAATVILAMGAGKTAARAIDAYLNPAASPTGQTI